MLASPITRLCGVQWFLLKTGEEMVSRFVMVIFKYQQANKNGMIPAWLALTVQHLSGFLLLHPLPTCILSRDCRKMAWNPGLLPARLSCCATNNLSLSFNWVRQKRCGRSLKFLLATSIRLFHQTQHSRISCPKPLSLFYVSRRNTSECLRTSVRRHDVGGLSMFQITESL